MMKKGVAGAVVVPAILAAFVIFFLVYIVEVESSERARILGYEGEAAQTGPTIEPQKENILLEESVGFVGRGTGNLIASHLIGDFHLSYPSVIDEVFQESQIELETNLLKKGGYTYEFKKTEKTEKIYVVMTVDDFAGNPDFNIKVNGVEKYSSKLKKGEEISIEAPLSELSDKTEIKIECVFDSWIVWETQSCTLSDFKVKELWYKKGKEKQSEVLTLGSNELIDGTLKLLFKVNQSSGNNILIKLNNVLFYKEKPEKGQIGFKEEDMNVFGIGENNALNIEVEKGSEYSIEDLEIDTYEKVTKSVTKESSFLVSSSELSKAGSFWLYLTIDEVVAEGSLEITFSGEETVELSPLCPSTISGCASYLKIGENKIRLEKAWISNSNILILKSTNGRFKISKLKVVWK